MNVLPILSKSVIVNASVSGCFASMIWRGAMDSTFCYHTGICRRNCQYGFSEVRGCTGACRTGYASRPFCCNCADGFNFNEELQKCVPDCYHGLVFDTRTEKCICLEGENYVFDPVSRVCVGKSSLCIYRLEFSTQENNMVVLPLSRHHCPSAFIIK